MSAVCEGFALLTWNADSDLDLFLLPGPASSLEDTFQYHDQPGYDNDEEADCLLDPSDTLRSAMLPLASAATTHVAVWMFSGCENPPQGPENNGPDTVTFNLFVQRPDGSSFTRSDTITKETDGWRLYPMAGALQALVTLAWNTDTNLALWVLPNPASNEEEALAQAGLPGQWDRREGWCNSATVTLPREAVIGDLHAIEPETRYIAVKFVDFCRRAPNGPEGDGPQATNYTLTVRYSDGDVDVITDSLAYETDNWRLHGPSPPVR